jgi:hypothetical protein
MKKQNNKDTHPIFNTCIWRFGTVNINEDKLQKCAECYATLTQTTEYCEHMKNYYWNKEVKK